MKKIFLALCAVSMSAALSMSAVEVAGVPEVPKSYLVEAANKGVIDTLRYDVEVDGKLYQKQALVYLPYGYNAADPSKRYNVLYLAHGGGDHPGSFFESERSSIPVDRVADHLIGDGKMDPIIIVSVSYYRPEGSGAPGDRMANMTADCRDFHREMRNFIIPAVGKKYNTYLSYPDNATITATRDHRAYGGFSMGSLSTWYMLGNDADAFSRFVPLCGDLWVFDEAGNKQGAAEAAKWLNTQLVATPWRGQDLQVYGYTGSDDIAYVAEDALINELAKESPVLVYSKESEPGNLHFNVLPKGVHNYEFVNRYLMDAMPRLWPKAAPAERPALASKSLKELRGTGDAAYSVVDMDCRSENGKIVGSLYIPRSSAYEKDGKLPIVVMSHGFDGNYQEVDKYAESVAANGVAAYVFDFCGGAMNSRSEGKTTDMSVLSEKTDLEAIIKTLRQLPFVNGSEVMLLGCSQGALVSTITAADPLNGIKALMMMYPAYIIPETAPKVLESSKGTPLDIKLWNMKLSQKYYRELLGLNPFERIAGYANPALIVYGEKDGITPEASVESFRAAVPQVQVKMIKDGEHGFRTPAHHRESEDYVVEFVRSVLK